jgi:hypothetical protein
MINSVELSKMPSIPVCWLTSKLNGVYQNTFTKPELKAERILSMVLIGHEEIQEPWGDTKFSYMGTFDKENSPF